MIRTGGTTVTVERRRSMQWVDEWEVVPSGQVARRRVTAGGTGFKADGGKGREESSRRTTGVAGTIVTRSPLPAAERAEDS